jgi:hypothetical protein
MLFYLGSCAKREEENDVSEHNLLRTNHLEGGNDRHKRIVHPAGALRPSLTHARLRFDGIRRKMDVLR